MLKEAELIVAIKKNMNIGIYFKWIISDFAANH